MITSGLFARRLLKTVLERSLSVRVLLRFLLRSVLPACLSPLVFVGLMLAIDIFLGQGVALGQGLEQVNSEDEVESGERGFRADLGVDGKYRSGRWTQLLLTAATANQTYEVQTLDGDAVRYKYRIKAEGDLLAEGGYRTYFPAGPPGAPFEIFLVGEDDQVLGPPVFRTRLFEGLVDVDRPWVVGLGSGIGLETLGRNELLGLSGSLDVSLVESSVDMPDHWVGFDGVDLIVISGSSVELLRSMVPAQHEAIAEWISGGGHLLLTLGSRGAEVLDAAPWLGKWLVGEGEVQLVTAEPEGIETFVSARSPVQPFPAIRFSGPASVTLLSGRSSDRQALPLLTLQSVGLGKVTTFAGGLDESPLRGWAQFEDFVDRTIPDLLPKKRKRGERPVAAEVRYSEVAGQVRINLDRFASAGGARFSLIAAMVLALVGLIGPFDYFLINRWLGRPLLGWLSFPLTIVAFSAAIVLWNQQAAPTSLNQITVLDMDNETGLGRGFAWAQLYSDQAERFDLQFVDVNEKFDSGVSETKSPAEILTSPWGYAGRAFGGIEVAGEDIRLPSYQLTTTFAGVGRESNNAMSSRMLGVPLAPKSSRGVVGRWRFEADEFSGVDLKRRVGSDLLVGSLLNPFDKDLLDGFLVYRNLAYILPTRVPAGSRISAVENLPTKNFRWRLNRRQTAEDSTRSEAWNPANDENLDRLMEIVLFYGASGGPNYVGLNNRVVGDLDLSSILSMDKAILVGRFDESPVSLNVSGDGSQASEVNSLTYVRMVFPITNRATQSSSVRE